MATFQTNIFAHQRKANGSYQVKLRITHKRQSRWISTGLFVMAGDVTPSLKIKDEKVNNKCRELTQRCYQICNELGFVIAGMTVDELVARIKQELAEEKEFHLDFIEYMTQQAAKMAPGTASVYLSARNALQRYIGRDTLDIQEMTANFVRGLVSFIQTEPSQRGANRKDETGHTQISKGSRAISLYMTRIKSLYNRAKEEFNDEDLGIVRITGNPFKNIKVMPPAPTAKRAISAEIIQQIIDLPPFVEKRAQMARDCFLLSFALVGMNSVDMLTAAAPKKGIITYFRQKTATRRDDRAEMHIRIEKCIKPLIERYADPDGTRLFGFHHQYTDRNAFNKAINIGLRSVASAVGLDGLTFYAARHSWATIARTPVSNKKEKEIGGAGLDKYIVHEALNHVDDTMKVTDIYLVKNWQIIWDANLTVLNLFKWPSSKRTQPAKQTKPDNEPACKGIALY